MGFKHFYKMKISFISIQEGKIMKSIRITLIIFIGLGINIGQLDVNSSGIGKSNIVLTYTQIDATSFPQIFSYVTVTVSQEDLITELTKENFTVEEDGIVQDITVEPVAEGTVPISAEAEGTVPISVEAEGTVPISVALVIDRSYSMAGDKIEKAKAAASDFVDRIGASDEAAIISFSTDVVVNQDFTSDKFLLKSAIDSLIADGETVIYDALLKAADKISGQSGIQAIILLSDGKNKNSVHSIDEAIAEANQIGVGIYTIGLEMSPGSEEEQALRRIAQDTGGQYFSSPTSEELNQIYQNLLQWILHQYQITYTTPVPCTTSTTRYVSITVNYNSQTDTKQRSYECITADIAITPQLDFGAVGIGTTASSSLIISNKGRADLTVTNIMTDRSEFTVPDKAFTVKPGDSHDVEVRFTPTAKGAVRGNLSIYSDDPDESPLVISLLGSGVVPQIEVSTTKLDFDKIPVGESADLKVTVSNVGTADLKVTDIMTDRFEFTVSDTAFTVKPDGSHDVEVKFTPRAEGTVQGKLGIYSNDSDNSPLVVALFGLGVAPQIEVSTIELDFGDVPVGESADLKVTVSNVGEADLKVEDIITDSPEFTVPDKAFTVKPGDNHDVEVKFTPRAKGTVREKLSIYSNDSDSSPLVIALFSSGVVSQIVVSTIELDFGDVPVGESADLKITVSNVGEADLKVTDIMTDRSEFTVSETTFNIRPHDIHFFDVHFTPRAKDTVQGKLSIYSNDLDELSLVIALFGSGIVPEIEVSITKSDNISVGESAALKVTVSNVGEADLKVTDITSDSPEFTIPDKAFTVKPGNSHEVEVIFTPTEGRKIKGNLRIISNDLDESPLIIALSVTGIAPKIVIEPEQLDFGTVDVLDFGTVDVGESKNLELTVSNVGTAQLEVTANIVGNQAEFSVVPEGLTVESAIDPLIVVSFTPLAGHTANGRLEITSNDPNNPHLTFELSGSGIGYYTVALQKGFNLIALPLDPQEPWRMSDLIGYIGDEAKMVIHYHPESSKFIVHSPSDSLDCPNNALLTPASSYIVIMDVPKSVTFKGVAWDGNILLKPGMNFTSLPLNPENPWDYSDLAEFVGENLIGITFFDKSKRRLVDFDTRTPGINPQIIGGDGFILTMKEETEVTYSGTPWQDSIPNASPILPIASATSNSFPLAVVQGIVKREENNVALSDLTVVVKNLTAGWTEKTNIDSMGRYIVAHADFAQNRAIRIGDVLAANIFDQSGTFSREQITHIVTADDIDKGLVSLPSILVSPIPQGSALLQNFPNPFNPDTWLPYQLAKDSDVTISIYNTKGQIIRTLEIGNQKAGIYMNKDQAAYWDGKNSLGEKVVSGIYFYTFQAGKFETTKRMAIMK